MNRWALGMGIVGICAALFGCGDVGGPAAPSPSVVTPEPPVPPPPAPPAPPGPPPGIAIYRGVVREAGGGPVAGVSIRPFSVTATEVARTDAQGAFEFTGVADFGLFFVKDEYQWAMWRHHNSPLDAIVVAMDRGLRLSPGSPLRGRIFPDSPTYSLDQQATLFWDFPYYCGPCRYVDVSPRIPPGARIRLRWTGDVLLTLVMGVYYGNGPEPYTLNHVGDTELTAVPSTAVETILVGPARLNDPNLTSAVDFTLTVE